jgi:hypothetical protein
VREARAADARVPAEVKRRRAEQERFDARPDIVRARAERHGNGLVRDAIAGGDADVRRLAEHDLARARDEMLRRDREAERRRAAALRRQREHERAERRRGDQAAPAPQPGEAAPAPAGARGPR